MRLITIIVLAILWLLFGIYFVKPCFMEDCNCTTSNAATNTAAPQEESTNDLATTIKSVTGPLLFSWNKESAITGDGWDARRNAILEGLADDEKLEITGNYQADEVNSTAFENLGLARADAVAQLLKPPLTDDRIVIKGQLVKGTEADKTANFKSVEFRNLKDTESIKEIDDRTLIYFPFNSVDRLNSKEVETYLNDVSERVNKTGESVRLTGHTDNVDSEAFNYRLGMRRANIVKRYLVGKGVDPAKIIVQSKGELQPIAPNDTEAGRAKNRRTELQIIK